MILIQILPVPWVNCVLDMLGATRNRAVLSNLLGCARADAIFEESREKRLSRTACR